MNRTLATTLSLATLLLAACSGPTNTTRIETFTTSAERAPRGTPITLQWQATNPGTQAGQPSCILTRTTGDDPTETPLSENCTGPLTETPPSPPTATAVHYQLKVLRQPPNASTPYLTKTRSITLDPAFYGTRAGGTGTDYAFAVSALPDGSAIVVGSFTGTAQFGGATLTSAGDRDVFVARIDPNGSWTWAKSAGGGGSDQANGVSALPDGGAIVVGRFTGAATFGNETLNSAGSNDVFVARVDPDGNWSWATNAGGTGNDVARSVSARPDGSAIVVGSFSDTAAFDTANLMSAGGSDVFVARVTADGNWAWARRAGGDGSDDAQGVSVLPDGGAIVTGSFTNTATFGSTPALTSAGGPDAFVASIDASGTWTWATRAGGDDTDEAIGVSAFADGSAIVTGFFFGTATFGGTSLDSDGKTDTFVARIGADGAWTWARRAGGADFVEPRGVGTLPDGSAIVAGSFRGSATFGTTILDAGGFEDAYVARIDAGGTWTWARSAGGTSSVDDGAYTQGMSVLADGGALVVGYFAGAATFRNALASAGGGIDVFVARIGASGAW
jgi:hypothetical protein